MLRVARVDFTHDLDVVSSIEYLSERVPFTLLSGATELESLDDGRLNLATFWYGRSRQLGEAGRHAIEVGTNPGRVALPRAGLSESLPYVHGIPSRFVPAP